MTNSRWRPKALDTAPDDSREWLIYSMAHKCWHCRSNSGGANGYTDDLLVAGLFETNKARQYHDGVSNRAVHISKERKTIQLAHQDAIDHLNSRMNYAKDLLTAARVKHGPLYVRGW
jgi:hypothetical protein